MIRLYVDHFFEVGKVVPLPSDERRYFQSVRRGKGDVCLFNRQGQIALGQMDEDGFHVLEVRLVYVPSYRLRVAMALPDLAILPLVIRGLSELGVEQLELFRGERSQGSVKKVNLSRMQKAAIEACRQCGRGEPLDISLRDKGLHEMEFRETNRIIFDESEAPSTTQSFALEESTVLLLGSEGGWTKSERDIARQSGFVAVHFRTPILRVETAALAGSLWALERIFKVSGD